MPECRRRRGARPDQPGLRTLRHRQLNRGPAELDPALVRRLTEDDLGDCVDAFRSRLVHGLGPFRDRGPAKSPAPPGVWLNTLTELTEPGPAGEEEGEIW